MTVAAAHSAASTTRPQGRARREAGIVTLAMFGYFGLRLLVEGDEATATRNAERLLDLEDGLGIAIERDVQSWVLDHDLVRWTLSASYVWLHWPLLLAAMTYLTLRAPSVQVRLRNALIASGAVGVVFFTFLPMAPPRFMPGFVGTVSDAARRHYLPYSLEWTNAFAAFPSYHVGWTLVACLALAGVVRRGWPRVVVLTPAVLVAAAVVGTGNHYVLDTVAAAVLALTAWFLAGRPQDQPGSEQPGSGPPGSASTVTVPASPSTRTSAPSAMREDAPVAATTQGRPSSRDTITA